MMDAFGYEWNKAKNIYQYARELNDYTINGSKTKVSNTTILSLNSSLANEFSTMVSSITCATYQTFMNVISNSTETKKLCLLGSYGQSKFFTKMNSNF